MDRLIAGLKSFLPGPAAAILLLLCTNAVPAPAQPARPRPTVAVLPLDNASGEADQEYLADGLTDEIAYALTGAPGVGVVARSSAFRFKEGNRDLRAIGKALNATYLVQGTARLVADRVRINVWLVEADTGVQLWSQDYYTELPNIFDIEEDAAENIAAALKAQIPAGTMLVRNRTQTIEAYQDFLRAKVAGRARGAQALADSAKILETVVAREPDYAPAAAMLAYDDALIPLFQQALRSNAPDQERQIVERTIPKADALARAAVQHDPKGADGYVALGYANLVQRKMIAAEDAFKQALALDPNQADGLHGYSQFLAAMGKIKESLVMRDHLQAIEQFIVNYTADTAEIVWLDGDTDKALAMLQPFRPGRTLEMALIQASAGRYKESAALIREMPATNYFPGFTENAAKVLESAPVKAASESLPKLGSMSFAYMHVGAPERVLEFYEDEIKAGYFQPISATWFWHPSYAAVRKTERFKKLARDLGMVDYWRARGWPAQCRPMGADDFVCD